jgi:flavin reductase (DIM6/NTAB) family NADH-FMN oxidoreductase RutF
MLGRLSASPPRVRVCLDGRGTSKRLVERAGCFAVHILGREHTQLGLRFAKRLQGVDFLFDGMRYHREATGSPILFDCLA